MKKKTNSILREAVYLFTSFIIIATMTITTVEAQSFPSKPIKVIVGFKAGGGVDAFTRIIGRYAKKYWGQKLIVVNKPGAGGQIGWNALSKSRKDGYTIATTVIPNIIIQPKLRKKGIPGYQTSDLIQLGTVCQIPTAVFANIKDERFTSLNELITFAKKHPGSVSAGLAAVKSGPHALGLMLEKKAGIDLNIIPSGGGAKAFKQVLGGHVDLMMANAMFVIKGEKTLQPLGLASDKPYPLAPRAPLLKDQGINIVDYLTRGFAVAKGTPQPIIDYLREGLNKMVKDKDLIKDLVKVGLAIDFLNGDETDAFIANYLKEKAWVLNSF